VALSIRTSRAEQRAKANPSNAGITHGNWEEIVRLVAEDGAEDREAAEAARQLLAFARQHRFNYFEEAQNTLQFVQSVPYATDADTKGREYFRYAIETLFENTGDCDCKAILAASLFRLMGLKSVVLLSDDEQHAAVAVEGAPDFPGNRYFEWNGARLYFCETTDSPTGFTVGEVPPSVNLDSYARRIEIAPALLGGSSPPS
jgi:transglutaminase-like putative cysteine protease